MERRLAAIMCADVVGYSRLMGANEVATLTALNQRRAEVIDPRIAESGGRIVKLTGDGLLAEFASVVGAVECATLIQDEMRRHNEGVPQDRRIELRIGINLGDIIVQDGDIFGDGVNVAARLEGVGTPGGVTVSEAVRQNIGNRLAMRFVDRGDQLLKNIATPIRAYDVAPDTGPEVAAVKSTDAECGCKPSIAVLPFENMSGDQEQDYFSDGICEDMITDLSKLSGLFVVGRNSSFAYKGRSHDLRMIAKELGVRFLLEGSVRKSNNRVRINAQLINGIDGGHVWADRYDRDLTDIFAIQDEITTAIVGELKVHLMPAEQSVIEQAPTGNVEAYSHYLKGRQLFHNATRPFLGLARRLFVKAIELDPGFARAYAGIANCDCRLMGWYGETFPKDDVLRNADRAIELDPLLAEAHAARGDALGFFGDEAGAAGAFREALRLDPNSFDANYLYARHCARTGQYDRAVDLYTRALEVAPDDPQSPLLLVSMLKNVGRIEEARRYSELGVKRAEEALRQHPEWSRPAQLAGATLAALGQREQATIWTDRALAIDPDDGSVHYNAACTFAQLGDADRALALLERWVPNAGREKLLWLTNDTDFDPLRSDPRFEAILAKVQQSVLRAELPTA